jgi:hypothetical protein
MSSAISLETLNKKTTTDFLNSVELQEKEKSLTSKEMRYWRMMKARSGVPYLRGPVGTAKSAISETIAKKLGMHFIDLRLGSADETDLGAYPFVIKDETSGVHYVEHLANAWAIEANNKPTIIAIEEVNRTRKAVQDAALQLLNERRVGNVRLNENVFLIASGNIGDEDGTEVADLDAAANNRLFHIKHTLTLKEWKDGFANENILPDLLSFLDGNASFLTEQPKLNAAEITSAAFGTFRSWTNLNNYIVVNNLNLMNDVDILEVFDIGCAVVGVGGATKLKKYLLDRTQINLNTILTKFDEVEKAVLGLGRIQKSDLLKELHKVNIFELPEAKYQNALKFICTIDDDELAGELLVITSDADPKYLRTKHPRIVEITQTHPVLAPMFKKMRNVSLGA